VGAAHGNAERCRRGGRKAAVGFGSGARELARKPEEWAVEVDVVLKCARERSLELRSGLSTATRRWRPADARGSRGTRKRGQRGGERDQRQGEDDAW
jgi:hypothetical protein